MRCISLYVLLSLQIPLALAGDPAHRTIDGWGKFIDPDGDCRFDVIDNSVVLTLGPGPHTLDVENGQMNSPQIVSSLSDDFSVSTVVAGDLPLPSIPRAYISGGLILMQDQLNYIRLERASFIRNGTKSFYTNFEQRIDGKRTRMGMFDDFALHADRAVELRLEVRSGTVRALVRHSGEQWHQMGTAQVDADATFLAGVTGVKSISDEVKITFSRFSITKDAPVDAVTHSGIRPGSQQKVDPPSSWSPPATSPLTDAKRAVLAFDIQVDEIVNLVGEPELNRQSLGVSSPNRLRRIYGAVSAPKSMAAIRQLSNISAPLEFDLFIRLVFATKEDTDKQSAWKENHGLEVVTIDGVEFFKPKAQGRKTPPVNLLGRRVSPIMLEFGTQDYVLLPNRNVFTSDLNKAWSNMPAGSIRLAIDFGRLQPLLDDALRTAPGAIPFEVQPLVAIAQSTRIMHLRIGLTDQELMRVQFVSKDDASAKQLHLTLSGMLEAVKHGMRSSLDTLEKEIKHVATNAINSLNVSVNGTSVTIVASRPEGLEKALAAWLGKAKLPNSDQKQDSPAIFLGPDTTEEEREAFNKGLLEGFMDAAKSR